MLCCTVLTCAGSATGSAASRPEKRIKLEVDLEPAPFNKRRSHPPFVRGGYNSEEWVFDDEDEDDLPAEAHEYGDQEDPQHYSAGIPDDSIRSLEVSFTLWHPGLVSCVYLLPQMLAAKPSF